MKTHYALAWESYKESSFYQTSVKVMNSKGMVQPHIDNILQDAFSAGYRGHIKTAFSKMLNSKKK